MADMVVNISIWRYFATYDARCCGYVTWWAHMMVDNKLDIDRYVGRYYGRYARYCGRYSGRYYLGVALPSGAQFSNSLKLGRQMLW